LSIASAIEAETKPTARSRLTNGCTLPGVDGRRRSPPGRTAQALGVMVKLFLGRGRANGREVLLLGQLCPPCVGVIGLDEIEAVHRTIGEHQGFLKILPCDADYEAYQLVSAFAGKAEMEPINAEWRPMQPVALRVDAA
jgi:hypothetical protein